MENNKSLENELEFDLVFSGKEEPITEENSTAPAATLKFEIQTAEEFVFDDEPPAKVEVAEAKNISSPETEKKEELEAEVKDDFDIFSFAEKERDPARVDSDEYTARSRKLYVPRFTEASESYRVIDAEKKVSLIVSAKKDQDENFVDPTAEMDGENSGDGKIIVTPFSGTRAEEPVDSSINIFKFKSDEDESNVRTKKAEDSEEDILDVLFGAVATPEPEESDALQSKEQNAVPDEKPKTFEPFGKIKIPLYEYEKEGSVSPEDTRPYTMEKSGKRRITEFNSPAQRDSLKDAFLDSLMSARVRLAAVILILVSIVTVNVLEFLGVDVLGGLGLGGVAGAMAIFDLMFGTCLFILAIPETVRTIKYAVRGYFTPELSLVLSYIALVTYDLVMIFAVSGSTPQYSVFGLVFAVHALATVIGSCYRRGGDYAAFKIISKNGVKTVIDKRPTRILQRENLAVDGAVDEYSSQTARTFKTAFVSDFYKKCAVSNENSRNVLITLGASVAIAIVSGVVSFLLLDLEHAMTSFVSVVLLACPAFSMLIHKIPYKHTEREAAAENSTFIGESSIYSHSDIDVIAYEDTEIFGEEDVSLKKVHLYGKTYNLTKAMTQMYAVFSVVGGPLGAVFSASLDRKSVAASGIVIEDDGVCGEVSGKRIHAGTEDYMRRHGVLIPEDDYKTRISATDSTKVMYGAEDGKVYVKFFIRYSFSEEFTMLLPHLKAEGIVPLIYTRDPNITNDLLKMLTLGDDIIRVMKKHIPKTTEEKTYRRISAGVATLGDKSNAINMVLLAKRYTKLQSGLALTELIAMGAGAAMGVLLSMTDIVNMPSLVYGIWQFAFMVYLYFVSRRTFKVQKKELEDPPYDANSM